MLPLALLALLLAPSADAATTAEVYNYIATDQVDRARELLGALVRTEYANAERLYLSGLLTADADSAVDYYTRALDLADEDHDDDITAGCLIGLADYALMAGNPKEALDQIDHFRKHCDHSARYPEVLRLRALLRFRTGDEWDSHGEVKDALKDCTDPVESGRLALAAGDIYFAHEKYDDAAEFYRDLSNRSDKRYLGAAALRLTSVYLKDNKSDEAQLTYNVLRSQQPLTLGLKSLSSRFGGTEPVTTDNPGPETGTYAIRVGTYTELDAAEQQQRRFAVQGYTAKINRVRISGTNYYVVDVGQFDNKQQAAHVMEQLAKANRDTYHLVTY